MSGLLVQLDAQLREQLLADPALCLFSGLKLKKSKGAIERLSTHWGIPTSGSEFLAMPVLCVKCGMFSLLDQALDDVRCPKCAHAYWQADTPGAVRALIRIDWRQAFDLLVSLQGNMLVRPMLAPMYQEKPKVDWQLLKGPSLDAYAKVVFGITRMPLQTDEDLRDTLREEVRNP